MIIVDALDCLLSIAFVACVGCVLLCRWLNRGRS